MFNDHSTDPNKLPTPGELQNKKENENKNSIFKFLLGYIKFDPSDPLWYRLVVIIIIVIATVVVLWSLKEWAAPAIVAEKISQLKLSSFSNLFKNKLP